MRTKEEIQERLDKILKDERLSYPPAQIQINAPLALIQVDLTAEKRVLEWILGS